MVNSSAVANSTAASFSSASPSKIESDDILKKITNLDDPKEVEKYIISLIGRLREMEKMKEAEKSKKIQLSLDETKLNDDISDSEDDFVNVRTSKPKEKLIILKNEKVINKFTIKKKINEKDDKIKTCKKPKFDTENLKGSDVNSSSTLQENISDETKATNGKILRMLKWLGITNEELLKKVSDKTYKLQLTDINFDEPIRDSFQSENYNIKLLSNYLNDETLEKFKII